jgi:hypothetical protein
MWWLNRARWRVLQLDQGRGYGFVAADDWVDI